MPASKHHVLVLSTVLLATGATSATSSAPVIRDVEGSSVAVAFEPTAEVSRAAAVLPAAWPATGSDLVGTRVRSREHLQRGVMPANGPGGVSAALAGDPAERTEDEPGARTEPVFVTADGDEIDAARLRTFLAGRGAPLADHAESLVAAGIAHDVDPRVVVGIAVAESSGGEALPSGTHNAWGWGGSGPHGLAAWNSWDEAIDDYTRRLGELYDTDRLDESFARTYCPPNWRWWLDTVTWVVGEI